VRATGGVSGPRKPEGAPAHGDHAGVGTVALALGALGVVFGDIGTSPLYAFREAFEHHDLTVNETNALGLASLAFWSLVVIISVKYLALVMRADNNGEGGILSLAALVMPKSQQGRLTGLVLLGVFGTALLYGDGVITPAISVLSAVEGFEVASTAFDRFVVPVSCVLLVGLFLVQRRGTGAVGAVFGPIMVVWFAVLGVLGFAQVVQHPSVIEAVNPVHIVQFFSAEPAKAFLALGSIFLVVTGGEALYADMGHFGRRPITAAWYAMVFPALVLNYFGQAALLTNDPSTIENPFYRLAPEWAVPPLAVLATMASIIASQALISGAFSLTMQAVQLDFLPRVRIQHTSDQHQGQVYVPLVNWALMVGAVGLVLGFRTSSNLASAYGIAVTATMVITSILFYVVVRTRWGWSTTRTFLVVTPLLVIDSAFLTANIPKIPHGGWFSLLVGLVLLVQMATWRKGRELVAMHIQRGERRVADVLAEHTDAVRVAGTAVFLFKDLGRAPPALVNNLRHNKVLHEHTLVVSVVTADIPRVPAEERSEAVGIEAGVHQVLLRFGFMEEPDVPAALAAADIPDVDLIDGDVTYFVGRESVLSTEVPGMHPALEKLYVLEHRGADSAARFFNLPAGRVFEVGAHVEI
jgi:KUP system potassium uptake protein